MSKILCEQCGSDIEVRRCWVDLIVLLKEQLAVLYETINTINATEPTIDVSVHSTVDSLYEISRFISEHEKHGIVIF